MGDRTKEQLVQEIALLRREAAELKQEKAERKRAERLLQGLNEASRSMEQALTPDEIFSAVAGELEKLGFRCTVFLTDQGRKRLFLKYWSYKTAAIKAAERLVGRKHEDFPILIEAVDEYGKTVWERETVFIENVKDVIRQLFQPVLPGPSKKLAGPVAKLLKVSKDINAPLIAGDEVVGMLSVQSGDLTRDDMPAITAFAYQMAAAWHKATLLQDLKRNLAERNRAEEALQKAHDELERRVEERTAELVESNEQLTREITERKRMEEAVGEESNRAQKYLDVAGVMFVGIYAKEEVALINQKGCEILGYEQQEVIGKNWFDNFLPEGIKDEVKSVFQKLMARQIEPIEYFENPVLTKSGQEKMIAWHNTVLRDGAGNIIGTLSSGEDITERKRAEEKLKESEERYRSLVNNIRLGIFRNTPGPIGKFLEVNPAMEEITGYSREELLRVNVSDLYQRPQERRAFAEEIVAVVGKTITKELRFRRKDGAQIVVSDTTVAVRDDAGQVQYFDGILEDTTERKQAEERVQHLNLVLRAIRSVNQVIARETDRSQLLKGICRSLTETRGYYNVWIALLDESGKLRECAESGLGDDFLPMKKRLERGELTHCARRALEQFSPIMTENPPVNCSDCPLSGNYKGRGALTTRLQQGAKCYGIMSLSTPAELLSDDEEVVLFREIADDIAFALGSLELEERRKKAAEELEESEERYRALVEAGEHMGEAIILLQDTDKVEAAHLFANDEWVRMTGYSLEELRGISYLDLIHPRDRDAVADRNRRRFQGEDVPGRWEISIVAKDGTELPVEGAGTGITYKNRPAAVGYNRDITERKKAEQELKESEERYQAMAEAGEHMGEAIILLQNTDKVEAAHLFANQEWVWITGYTPEELREISYFDLIHPRDRDAVADRNRRRLEGEDVAGLWEIHIIAKDGTEVPVEGIGALLTYQGRPAVAGYIRDITERKRAEEKLKASLEEKEVLLKEIHHRVKNNLQVISSLLKLQSGYIEDARYAGMFKDSQDRVKSMALVHEKLYQSEDLARIDFAGYIESVVQELRRSYGAERAGIGIKTEVEDVKLGVDYAIPCGLIINELVSNSLKHAFPEGKRGEVRIAMRQVGRDEVELEVSDNGVGLPESVGVRNAESLGLRLVSMLAEDQLVGEIKVDRGKGTRFRIGFRVRE